MTIRRGEEWGTDVPRPDPLAVAATDAELAGWVASDPGGSYVVTGGDLHRTLGGGAGGQRMRRVPLDRLVVRADEAELSAVAHVVARRSWWRGPVVAVMNVDHVGRWNVAPRAHPNDGRFEVVEVDATMSPRQRWQARQRLPLGTHLPHPAISVRSTTEVEWTFERPVRLWVDGVDRGVVHRLGVTIDPDAFALHV